MTGRRCGAAVVEPFTFRSLDGLTLAGDRAGDRGSPSVLLLHGGGQTRHSWRSAQRELAACGYHVLNLDSRGHGDSQWAASASEYSLGHLAGDILTLIDSLPNAPALVGASMGGLAALTVIGSHPQAASALVLVDVVPRVETQGAERILRFMRANPEGFDTAEDAAASIAAYNPHRPFPKRLDGLLKNLRPMASGRLRWHWDPQVLGADTPAYDPDRMLADCRQFIRPAMLVRGMRSDVVGERGIEELRASLPQLEVCDVATAGHMLVGDKNDLFNQAMLAFLGKHLKP
jgi:pimeloyl-ACP methyl ester carboxylesterase